MALRPHNKSTITVFPSSSKNDWFFLTSGSCMCGKTQEVLTLWEYANTASRPAGMVASHPCLTHWGHRLAEWNVSAPLHSGSLLECVHWNQRGWPWPWPNSAVLSYNCLLGQCWVLPAVPGTWAQATPSSSSAISQYAQNSLANSELIINLF